MSPAPIPVASRLELAMWMLRRRTRFSVMGPSMEPTLRAGQVVLVDERATPQIGDVVVALHPRRNGLKIVKRVAAGSVASGWELASDNAAEPHSEDSRTFGPVAADRIVGRITSVVR